ncbi:MAG TPA: acetate kinase [Bacillota bacterium]|nr:acetate kinase [Bacillota bacterium]
MFILVVNAGSSSLKYQLFDMDTEQVLCKGLCEKISETEETGAASYTRLCDNKKYSDNERLRTHTDAAMKMINMLLSSEYGVIKSLNEISAVGHRIVNGGKWLIKPVLVNDSVKADLNKCIGNAPVHTKAHIMGLNACIESMPDIPQVLVIDTDFHSTMPAKAYTYPIDKTVRERYTIRRYGFHGTSHRYVSAKAIEYLGGKAQGTKIVTCHLGNGSSIGAVKDGKIVDTSMGFTPLEGVIMGTRCGSVDPAIIPFIMEKENIPADKMGDWMNKQCGFYGMCGASDLRDVADKINAGDEEAKLALDILAYQIQKYIGSYTAAMDGIDALVFTAGIGENNVQLREMICENMDFFGIKLDKEKNRIARTLPEPADISAPSSRVRIYVIPTNEELVIARDTLSVALKDKD